MRYITDLEAEAEWELTPSTVTAMTEQAIHSEIMRMED